MEIIKPNTNDRETLNKLGYDSNIYYCGNYSMQKYYSYIYNFLRSLGVNFALNRACFIHDLNYNRKPNLTEKMKIDFNFFLDMIKCIWYEYKQNNIGAKHAYYLIPVAFFFYFIVIISTPFYIKQGKIIQKFDKNTIKIIPKNKNGIKIKK